MSDFSGHKSISFRHDHRKIIPYLCRCLILPASKPTVDWDSKPINDCTLSVVLPCHLTICQRVAHAITYFLPLFQQCEFRRTRVLFVRGRCCNQIFQHRPYLSICTQGFMMLPDASLYSLIPLVLFKFCVEFSSILAYDGNKTLHHCLSLSPPSSRISYYLSTFQRATISAFTVYPHLLS